MEAAEPDARTRRRPVAAILALLVAIGLSVWALTARGPDERLPLGFSIGGQIAQEPPAAIDRDLDRVRRAGATWVRLDVSWAQVQNGGPSSYDWIKTDRVIQAARTRGLRVLASLAYTPPWARPPGADAKFGPAPADYAAFARRAVARYARLGVHDWEVWNEPNNDAFWTPRPDPAAYARLLVAGARAIRATDPRATVITGGLSPAVTEGGDIAPIPFLQAMYAAGARGAFDAVGHHPYTFPELPDGTHPLNAWHQMAGTKPSLRSVMRAQGDGGKEIWATEFGAPTDGPAGEAVGEAAQARHVTRAVALWSTYPWAGPLFVYSMRDLGTDPVTRENFFGLVRRDGSLKPAFRAFQEEAEAAR